MPLYYILINILCSKKEAAVLMKMRHLSTIVKTVLLIELKGSYASGHADQREKQAPTLAENSLDCSGKLIQVLNNS